MALSKPDQLEKLRKKLHELQASGFYGKVTVEVVNGNLILIRYESTEKLES